MQEYGLRDYGCPDTTFAVFEIEWTLGDFVRKLREQKGWNQQQLADQAGLHKSAIVRLEGDSDKSERTTVESAARALGVTAADLYAHADHAKVFAGLSATQRVRIAEVARQYQLRNQAAANLQSVSAKATASSHRVDESVEPTKARRAR